MNNLIKYNDGEIELVISLENDTVWLSQLQISELFETSTDNISLHFKNIYKEEELNEISTTEDFSVVRQEGKRKVQRIIKHYNLDAIICVGYRISSYKATKFRQWATSILKKYISNGYVINTHKITEQRLVNLENEMQLVKSKIENNTLEVKQGIFYNGQIFDAYILINNILKNARQEVYLIDNYIDESVLVLFTKIDASVKATFYTKNISKQLELDLKKYNSQYPTIAVKEFDLSHDRFIIIDETEVYHIGASLKDLGKKWFAVSKMEINSLELIRKLK